MNWKGSYVFGRIVAEENVTVIDLNAMSVKLLEGMTQVQADEFNATGHEDERAENKKSPVDRTHLNAKGQALFGRMVVDTLFRTQVELGPDVIGEPVKAKAAGTQ